MTAILFKNQHRELDLKDILKVSSKGSSLGAVTQTAFLDGRGHRGCTIDVRFSTSGGGTLTMKLYTTHDDVKVASVTNWRDQSSALLGAATVTASGVYSFPALRRWLKFEFVLTGSGNTLEYDISQGWGGSS